MKKEAVILAGGLGTRLRSVISNIPKPMAPVAGKPFLEFLLRYLRHSGYQKVILSVGYKWESIQDYFGSSYTDMELLYAVEDQPMGTGGALRMALNFLDNDTFCLLNGDSFCDVNLAAMEQNMRDNAWDILLASVLMPYPKRYGTIIQEDGRITSFHEKRADLDSGLINAGVYLLQRKVCTNHLPSGVSSLESDLLQPLAASSRLGTHQTNAYFIDIGIPEDYERAQRDFQYFKY